MRYCTSAFWEENCLKREASQAQVRELEQNFPSQHEVTNTECPSKTHNRE
jgi:hypothetical protein